MKFDIAVIGAGPAGLAATVALAACGVRTVCSGPAFAPDPEKPDTRTTALFAGSVDLLKSLNVWGSCRAQGEALKTIQMIDSTGSFFKAPDVVFHASEIGREAFGYNIPNTVLVEALHEKIARDPNATYLETNAVTDIDVQHDGVRLTLEEGVEISAHLVAGADGRHSLCRKAADIGTVTWAYEQTAIACNLEHSEQHNNISTEFHRNPGPFTVVPLPGLQSGLVWVERPDEACRLMKLDDRAFIQAMESQLGGLLGKVTSIGARACFPLSGLTAKSFGSGRIVLIGEAAHVIPPIGAQGLNLGFRDAASLAECVCHAQRQDGDQWALQAVRAYDGARRIDVWSRTAAVDLLNRSLISGLLPFKAARSVGLHALSAIAPLRRFAMRRGLDPATALPKLMQPGMSPADL